MKDFFSKIKPTSVAVIGDLIIDEYYQVNFNRVSPEYPIPVLVSENPAPYRVNYGGVGNIWQQLKEFDFLPRLFTGTSSFTKSHSFVPCVCARKQRFIQNGFPIFRRDIETPGQPNNDKLYTDYLKDDSPVAVFSDYDKGIFRKYQSWMQKDIIKIVDPKNSYHLWENCTIFKPNYKEACLLSGLKDCREQCDYFQNKLNCSVVITCGSKGVCGKQKKYFEYNTKHPILEKSVIGAGDCFTSFLAMTCLSYSLEEAAIIAYEAAAQFVSQDRILKKSDFVDRRIKITESKLINNGEKIVGNPLVFTNGCFDLLHPGHLHLLKFAKDLGSKLVVGLNSDDSVRRLKGETRPIFCLEDRIKMLSALEFVDYIAVFDEDTPYELIQEIKPDILVKGKGYREEDVVGRDLVKKVVICSDLKGYSTTGLIKKTGP